MVSKLIQTAFNNYTKPWMICILAGLTCAWLQIEINLVAYKTLTNWQHFSIHFYNGYIFAFGLTLLGFGSLLHYLPSKIILMVNLGLSLILTPLANMKIESTMLLCILLGLQIILFSGIWLATINLIARWLQAYLGLAYGLFLTVLMISQPLSQIIFETVQASTWHSLTIVQIISGAILYGLIFIIARDRAIKINLSRTLFEYNYYSIWQIVLRLCKNTQLWFCIYYLLPSTLILLSSSVGISAISKLHYLDFSSKEIYGLLLTGFISGCLANTLAGWGIDRLHVKHTIITATSLIATVALAAQLLNLVNGFYDYLALSFLLGICTCNQVAAYTIINDQIDPQYNSIAFGFSLGIISIICTVILGLTVGTYPNHNQPEFFLNPLLIALLFLNLLGLLLRPFLKPALFQRY